VRQRWRSDGPRVNFLFAGRAPRGASAGRAYTARAVRYLRIAIGSLLVVGAAGAGAFYLGRDRAPAPGPPPVPRVAEEVHYYVLLTLVEVEPGDWDTNDSPPDPYYTVRWQGQEVFQSTTKDNTLVAKWSNVAIAADDILHSVSIDDSIKAARITARKGDVIEFRVYDTDIGKDDLVGEWTVEVEDLHVGDQTWSRPGGRVVSAQCRVLPIEDVDFDSLTK